jgi:hypothetical protein
MERVQLEGEDRAKVVQEVRRRGSETARLDVLSGRIVRMERAIWGLLIFVMVLATGLVVVADVVLKLVNSGR